MGAHESKVEEQKTVDSTGAINNNLVLSTPVPIHYKQMEILIWIICIIKVLEFCVCIYKVHSKMLKKKYSNNPA